MTIVEGEISPSNFRIIALLGIMVLLLLATGHIRDIIIGHYSGDEVSFCLFISVVFAVFIVVDYLTSESDRMEKVKVINDGNPTKSSSLVEYIEYIRVTSTSSAFNIAWGICNCE